MEKNLKSVEVKINVNADVEDISKMTVVFDANRTTDMFNAITQAVSELEETLMQMGFLTKQGIAPAEFDDYKEYMSQIVEKAEEEAYVLSNAKHELMFTVSEKEYKEPIYNLIDERITELYTIIDNYYNMFDVVKVLSDDEYYEKLYEEDKDRRYGIEYEEDINKGEDE